MIEARKCIREIKKYHSPLTEANVDLRLDLNESTTGCSPRVLAKLRSLDAKLLALYPRRESGEKLVANFLGRKPEEILLSNGADEAIDVLCRAYLEAGDEVIIVVPAFAMYEIFAQASDAKTVRVPTGPDHSFPLAGMLQAVTSRTRLIVITNPNNPTGVAAKRAEILQLLEAAPDAAILLDEAYFDFYGETLMDQVGRIPNLFVARTFSKAYGLAGMRLGILAGAAEQIDVLRRITPPFNVNAFALECLAEALADRKFVEAYVHQVCTTREWLRHELELLSFKCWPSHTNFLLVDFSDSHAQVLEGMEARGIALRNRPDCKGCVRVSIGTQQEMERVLAALKQVLSEKPAQVSR